MTLFTCHGCKDTFESDFHEIKHIRDEKTKFNYPYCEDCYTKETNKK